MPKERIPREKGDKIWFTFQTTAELRNAISDRARKDRINASEFFRKCAEIFVSTDSMKEALKKVEKLAASLKLTGGATVKRKHNPKRKSKVVMPDTSRMI